MLSLTKVTQSWGSQLNLHITTGMEGGREGERAGEGRRDEEGGGRRERGMVRWER